jgi:predicted phosphate transport protein (TIGR00153 family)
MSNVMANIFGSSPVQPLEKHMDVVFRCAKKLRPFVAAVVEGDHERMLEVRSQIEALENEADEIKKRIRMHMPKSLFMPVPREDLLELLVVQDKIANRTRDASGIIMGRRMSIPAAIVDKYVEFVDSNIDAAKQARKSVRELDELFTAGFKGAEVTLVAELIEELDRIETLTDEQQTRLRSALFEIEHDLKPIDVMFLYEVIQLTGEIADMAERVGRRLELLLS